MSVRIVKLIFCDEGRRGRGVIDDVMRRVPSLYTLDGKLVCSFDVGPKDNAEVAFVDDKALSDLRGSGF